MKFVNINTNKEGKQKCDVRTSQERKDP